MILTPEELTGFDLQAIRRAIGRPWSAAMADEDELGLYAFLWRADVRDRGEFPFEDMLGLPLSEVMARWEKLLDVDPPEPATAVESGTT